MGITQEKKEKNSILLFLNTFQLKYVPKYRMVYLFCLGLEVFSKYAWVFV